MSHEETMLSIDANVDTTTAMEPLDTGHVEDAPMVAVPKPKKSKRAFSRGITKRGSLVDDDTFSPPKISIDNDSSNNVVESSDIPFEPTDCATNVPTMRQCYLSHLTNCWTMMTYRSNQFQTTNLSPNPQRQTWNKFVILIS